MSTLLGRRGLGARAEVEVGSGLRLQNTKPGAELEMKSKGQRMRNCSSGWVESRIPPLKVETFKEDSATLILANCQEQSQDCPKSMDGEI